MEEKETCFKCKSGKYLNKSLKLLVASCPHRMCENCVKQVYAYGSQPCPYPNCGVMSKKMDYIEPIFEDLMVENELRIRKQLSTLCKREEDFETLREYNDYLEEIEDIIFDLVNESVEVRNAKIKDLKEENKSIIARNILKQVAEDTAIRQLISQDEEEFREQKEQDLAALQDERNQKKEIQKKNLEQLLSDQSIEDLQLKRVKLAPRKKTTLSTDTSSFRSFYDRIDRTAKTETKMNLEDMELDETFTLDNLQTLTYDRDVVKANYSDPYFTGIKSSSTLYFMRTLESTVLKEIKLSDAPFYADEKMEISEVPS